MSLRLEDIDKKEVINYSDGLKLGHLGEAEFLIDCNTGKIKSLLLPEKKPGINLGALTQTNKSTIEIPWESVIKIGVDMVIVDIKNQKA